MLTTLSNDWCRGFIKIWSTHRETGDKSLIVDKDNLVLYSAADILSSALAGAKNSGITHMYVSYCNYEYSGGGVDPGFNKPILDKANTHKFSDYGSGPWEDYGYLRLPLAYPANLSSNDVNVDVNTVTFTSVVSTATAAGGADFQSTSPSSKLFEVALVNASDPASSSQDKLFSRAQFNPIGYDQNYNLTISWGIRFVV